MSKPATPDPTPATPAPALPPGIPAHMAGIVRTTATAGRPAAPAVHPTFGDSDRVKAAHRGQANMLRASLQAALAQARKSDAALTETLAYVAKNPAAAAVFADEGIDLDLVRRFQETLAKTLAVATA